MTQEVRVSVGRRLRSRTRISPTQQSGAALQPGTALMVVSRTECVLMTQSYAALGRPSEVWFISYLNVFQAQVRTRRKLRKISFRLWILGDRLKELNLAVTTYPRRMPGADAQCPRKGGVEPGPRVGTEGLSAGSSPSSSRFA